MGPPGSALVLIVCTLTVSLSGCFLFSGAGQAPFVVEFEIVDLLEEDGPRDAEPGHHCGSASMDKDTLTIGLRPGQKREEGPWLAVFPTMPDDWRSSLGAEPYKTDFPATLKPGVHDDPTSLGELEWAERDDGNATILLDDEPVSLPYTWEVTGRDGSWKAEATLSEWEGRVDFERTGYCA